VPLPGAFARCLGAGSRTGRTASTFLPHGRSKAGVLAAARAYLRGMLRKAGIEKKISHTNCATPTPPTCSTPART